MPGYANPEDRAAHRRTRRGKARKRSRPDHGTYYGGAYQAARRRWETTLAELGATHCHQIPCLIPGRPVYYGEAWDLAHDQTGSVVLGPSHPHCNRSDGACRGNRGRAHGTKRPSLPQW